MLAVNVVQSWGILDLEVSNEVVAAYVRFGAGFANAPLHVAKRISRDLNT
jgi:hypothetical protein